MDNKTQSSSSGDGDGGSSRGDAGGGGADIKKQVKSSLFLHEDGTFKAPMVLLMLSIPFLCTGRWIVGFTALVGCIVFALLDAVNEIEEKDKHEIRYNVMEAEDVLYEMEEWEGQIEQSRRRREKQSREKGRKDGDSDGDEDEDDEEGKERREIACRAKIVVSTGLAALAKKYGKDQQRRQHQQQLSEGGRGGNNDGRKGKKRLVPGSNDELSLCCQQAAYVGFRTFPNEDLILAASTSLLALVAKNDKVRERHLHEADAFGLNVPIDCLRASLERARGIEEGHDDVGDGENKKKGPESHEANQSFDSLSVEQQAAEIQRKGCLLLGALADGDTEMSCLVVQEGGLDVILEAADWYRYHEDVANWALWSIFNLCYENMANKSALVRGGVGTGSRKPGLGGVPIVVQVMDNCPESVEVCRHGIAVLFDLMRENSDNDSGIRLDVWKIRDAALAAGLHKVVVRAMKLNASAMDIIMMGQEILSGTGYQGDIPQFQPSE